MAKEVQITWKSSTSHIPGLQVQTHY